MKRLLTTVILTTISIFAFGQFIEWSDNAKFADRADQVHINSRGEIIVAGYSNFDEEAPPSLFILDDSGNLIVKEYFDNYSFEVGSINDMLELDNGEFLILGTGGLCDVCCWSTIQRYSEGWAPYFDWNDNIQLSSTAIKMAYDHTKLLYILNKDNSMDVFDLETLEVVLSLNFGDKEFNDVIALSSDEIIVAGQGVSYVQTVNEVTLPDYNFFQIEQLSDTSIIVASEKDIFILDDTFGIQHSFNLTNTTETIKQIAVSNTHIGILINTGTADKGVVFDHNLTLQQSFALDSVGVRNEAIAIQNNKLVIAGTELSKNRSMFGKQYSLSGQSTDYETDIGIINMEMGTPPFVKDTPPWGGTILRMEDIDFTIQNFGNTAVQDFRINARFEDIQFICYLPQTFRQNFFGLQLNPGESITVNIPELEILTYDLEPSFNFCFWTSIPNHKIDRNHTNDNYCKNIIINSTDEISPTSALSVSPNPANNELRIDIPEGVIPESIQIFDLYGKLVLEEKRNYFGESIDLNIKELSSGAYFVQVQSGAQKYLSKFIKM